MRLLRNKKTGEIKQVDDGKLGEYGLGPQAQPVASDSASSVQDPQKLKQIFTMMMMQQPKHIGEIKSVYDMIKPPEEDPIAKRNREEKDLAMSGYKNAAQSVLDVLDQKDAGALQGKNYEDSLNSTVSRMFLEGTNVSKRGANLTKNEQALLSGSLPAIQERGYSVLDWLKEKLTGYKPVQTGRAIEDPETIRNKVRLILGESLATDPKGRPPLSSFKR